jgi:predicted regulator of Ras-like GTPase activity (Roadblock/LC7/MglB family)
MSRASVFAAILKDAVESTPGAIGGAFAARDGETVDYVSTRDESDWALFTAHYGIVLSHIQSALHTFHFGEAEQVLVIHRDVDIVIQAVLDGYYAMLAIARPGSLARGMSSLLVASAELRREMA